MISRSGTRRSGAASGVAKIFRDEARGPVVTAGSVVSGLERMFIMYPPLNSVGCFRHCEERSDEAIHCHRTRGANGLLRFARNDGERVGHHAASVLWPS